jgi:hypothetical protein
VTPTEALIELVADALSIAQCHAEVGAGRRVTAEQRAMAHIAIAVLDIEPAGYLFLGDGQEGCADCKDGWKIVVGNSIDFGPCPTCKGTGRGPMNGWKYAGPERPYLIRGLEGTNTT